MRKNRVAAVLLLLLGLGLLLPGGSGRGQDSSNPAAAYIMAGDRLYEQGKFKEALASYSQALEADPQNEYVSLQIVAINVKLAAGEKPPGPLPPRDLSKLVYELGPYYKDPVNKFAIRYPQGWILDNNDPFFNVKFIDPYYEAFIFAKSFSTSSHIVISYDFQASIENLVRSLAGQVPGVTLKYNNFEKLLNEVVLRTEVHYRAGPNLIIINARFFTTPDRVMVVAWVCPEKLFPLFRPWLEPSVASLTLNPR